MLMRIKEEEQHHLIKLRNTGNDDEMIAVRDQEEKEEDSKDR
ncbi:MAG: hypothetical protein ACJ70S_02500 [Nitrososphaera sp.]